MIVNCVGYGKHAKMAISHLVSVSFALKGKRIYNPFLVVRLY